jgi:hypothetical protein
MRLSLADRPAPRLAGPALLLLAGGLRWVDGRDGSHGSEPWWTFGHLAFACAVVALVALVADLRRVAVHRGAASVALGVASVGATALAVAMTADLPGPWPDVLTGLFALGVVGALSALAWSRQVSRLEPALALLGFAAILVDLDLLPLGAALLAGAVAKAPVQDPQPAQPV